MKRVFSKMIVPNYLSSSVGEGENDILIITTCHIFRFDFDGFRNIKSDLCKAGYDYNDRLLCTLFTGKDYVGTLFFAHSNAIVESIAIKNLKNAFDNSLSVSVEINETDVVKTVFLSNECNKDFIIRTDRDKGIVFNSSLITKDNNTLINSSRLLTGDRTGKVVDFKVLEADYPEFGKYRVRSIPSLGYYLDESTIDMFSIESK